MESKGVKKQRNIVWIDWIVNHIKLQLTKSAKIWDRQQIETKTVKQWQQEFLMSMEEHCQELFQKSISPLDLPMLLNDFQKDSADFEESSLASKDETLEGSDNGQTCIKKTKMTRKKRVKMFNNLKQSEKALCEELGCASTEQKIEIRPTKENILTISKIVEDLESLKASRLAVADEYRPKFAAIVDELDLNICDESIIKKLIDSNQQVLKMDLVRILPSEYEKMESLLLDIKEIIIKKTKVLWQFFNSEEENPGSEFLQFFSRRPIKDIKLFYHSLMERKTKFDQEVSCCVNAIKFYRKISFKMEKQFLTPKDSKDLDMYVRELRDSRLLYEAYENLFLNTFLLLQCFNNVRRLSEQDMLPLQFEVIKNNESKKIADLHSDILNKIKIYEEETSERFLVQGVPFEEFFNREWWTYFNFSIDMVSF